MPTALRKSSLIRIAPRLRNRPPLDPHPTATASEAAPLCLRHRALRSLTLAGVLLAGTFALPARADIWGADLPVLGGILVTLTESSVRVGESLSTLRETYEATRRLAGYADDAQRAFEEFQRLNAQLFGQGALGALEAAYPDIGFFRRQAASAQWGEGSGELQRLLSACLSGPSGCASLQRAVSFEEARRALSATFGLAPTGAHDLAALDSEAATAIASGSAVEGRNSALRQELIPELGAQCGAGVDPASLAACQAAAASAQIKNLEVTTHLADQAAASLRLQATQLQVESQRRKRELREAEERRNLLLGGVEQSSGPPPPLQADGFDLFEE